MTDTPDTDTSNEARPKPASYGFDLDFDDLSAAIPATRAAAPKPKPKAVKKAPTKPAAKPAVRDAQDRLAKSMGFTSREAVTVPPVTLKRRRRTQHDEPVDQLSVRGPVRILNAFIEHCESQNLSYWEGLEILLEAK